jgi:hypothetical protein
MIDDARFHRRRNSQCLVNPDEVVPDCVERVNRIDESRCQAHGFQTETLPRGGLPNPHRARAEYRTLDLRQTRRVARSAPVCQLNVDEFPARGRARLKRTGQRGKGLQSPARTPTGRERDKGPASPFPLLDCHAGVHRPQKSGTVLLYRWCKIIGRDSRIAAAYV